VTDVTAPAPYQRCGLPIMLVPHIMFKPGTGSIVLFVCDSTPYLLFHIVLAGSSISQRRSGATSSRRRACQSRR
jgi:hypothetical protein